MKTTDTDTDDKPIDCIRCEATFDGFDERLEHIRERDCPDIYTEWDVEVAELELTVDEAFRMGNPSRRGSQ